MSIIEFLKNKIAFIIINIILFIAIAGIMMFIKTGPSIIFVIALIWFIPITSYMSMEYIKLGSFFTEINSYINSLDKKYLLPELIEEPEFIEGKIFYDILKETNKDMHENIKIYKNMQSEYREYIESWVHEIKTPIASSRLIIDNNKNDVTNKINIEIKKIEEYIDQALYYARSNDVNKDYIIKKISLKQVVRNTIKRNSTDFIYKGIELKMEIGDGDIYSDSKWVEFILNQIIGNAIKYSKEFNPKISITSINNTNNMILTVQDNGVGIDERDIKRVFEKGFTGENGRLYGKSTGMGLYLCNNLCEKLNIGLTISSIKDEGTKVNLIFPFGKYNNFN